MMKILSDFWLAKTDLLGGDARAQSSTSVFLPDAMFFPNTTVAAGPVYFSDLTNILTPAFFQDFNVNKQGTSSAMLTWTTSQEQDVSHFIIEKSYSQTSGIRSIRFSSFGEKEITIYPNPVKDGFNISIPVLNPQNKKIRLNLVNQTGQLLHAREIAAASASNYYYDIKTPGVIAGEYMLQIIMDGELLDTKKIIVQR
ncbi:MAG: T9SS type A sorting domain-containing protein [Chitinophagaceae bacterium]|nr:T9SS type A sorting domain-containing protein [Chitinophagaceae bacterium]